MDATLLLEPTELTESVRADHQAFAASDGHVPSTKEFAKARAWFALHGHALITSSCSADGKNSWVVSRWGHSRFFDNWPGVLEFLAQIGVVGSVRALPTGSEVFL